LSLKEKAIRGIKWTALSTVVGAVVQILKISILARFLSPEDFGLMALASVVIGFMQVFADGGVSNAIIYKQDITEKQLSSLYWFNVFVGFALFLVILGITPFFSSFYSEKELNVIIPIVGLTVFLQSFSFQFKALFEKKLLFNTVAKIEIISRVVSLIVAVLLAYEGFGVYALVYSLVVMVFLETVLFVLKGISLHKPSFFFSFKEIVFFIKFGLFQLGERITNYFSSQLDILLIGKLLGTEAVGIYSVVKQIVMRPAYLINPIVTRITFPVMSKFQNDIQKLKGIYLKTVGYVSSVNFPVYTGIIVLAPWIVEVLLGEEWKKSILIFQLLSVYFMFRAVGNPVGSLILARGRPDIEFYWNLVMLVYIPFWIFIGSFYGLEGVALALAVSHIFLVTIDWFFLVKRMCGASFVEYHEKVSIPLAVSLISGITAYYLLKSLPDIYGIMTALSVGFFLYISLTFLTNRDFIQILKHIFH
jgi:O-antigen/teichoic acid export membrane protein